MKISCAMITRGEVSLEAAVASIRPHVDEVVIVTNSEDPEVHARVASLADRYAIDLSFNFPDGKLSDFGGLRNRSFDIATHDAVVWLDSDDEVENAGHIRLMLDHFKEEIAQGPLRLLFPYEYAYNGSGQCEISQVRERVVVPKDAYHWVHPVHETIFPKDTQQSRDVRYDGVVWKHRKKNHQEDVGRNLRILRHYVERHGLDDPRIRYDFGCELAANGYHYEALEHLAKYVEVSNWDEERFEACIKAFHVHSFYSNIDDAEVWVRRAIEIMPTAFDGHFHLARLLFSNAQDEHTAEERAKYLLDCVASVQAALATPELPRLLGTNPQSRKLGAYQVLADALTQLGDGTTALDAIETLLEAKPGDPQLLLERDRIVKVGKPRPKSDRYDIVFACGDTIEPWNPHIVKHRGSGGSEVAVVEVARRLAARGHDARVYTTCGAPGVYDGVTYLPSMELYHVDFCEALVGWRNAKYAARIVSDVSLVWAHDLFIPEATATNLRHHDHVVAMTKWHAAHLAELYKAGDCRMVLLSNGVDTARFSGRPLRDIHRCVYSSSADRGLVQLLDMWPAIRAKVPDATLHVFYGFDAMRITIDKFSPPSVHLANQTAMKALADRLAQMADQGVVARGRVGQQVLADEMLSSGAWLFPTAFQETSCISAMEAQCAGLRVVTSALAALNETVVIGAKIAGHNESPEYQREFVDAAVYALTLEETGGRERMMEKAQSLFSWDKVADDWEAVVSEGVEKRRSRGLTPYRPWRSS